ncbi:hypothetical protein P5G61_05445 [Paenibacillus sp. F6_3S_P_1C]|uniref:DUF3800 domain-containing protein n=1 Tax=Paenibacillus vandeheii TaxID=3035917 RepID=A0ABT8J7Q8_9BACL|nr:hypothetical protein [Paenibacillus vandeheii]MDN4600661.1 hypothetical protein [Paenibacillus vandeheii]
MNNFKYYRFTNNDEKSDDSTDLSKQLYKVTGHHANDYINPVINPGGDLYTILSDESEFKGNYGVCLVMMPFLATDFLNRIEKQLEDLTLQFGIKKIHFTDIYGSKQLKNRRDEFISSYAEVVNQIPKVALFIGKNKEELFTEVNEKVMSNEEIYFTLFWNNFERIITIPNTQNNIYHISVEQEYSLDGKIENIADVTFRKLYSGIEQMYPKFPSQYISICKHPHFHSKTALLYSSLADLAAYVPNKIQQKIDSGIPKQKIIKNFKSELNLIKVVFQNYSGIGSEELVQIINES